MSSEQVTSRPNLGLPAVASRFEQISKAVKDDEELNTKVLPGLAKLLDEYLDPEVPVTSEDFIRRLLTVFHHSTDNTYEDVLDGYSDNEKATIQAFVKGKHASELGQNLNYTPSPAVRQELGHLQDASLPERFMHGLQEVKEEVQDWFGKEKQELQTLMHHKKMTDIGLHVDEHTLEVYENVEFRNWGRTIDNKPCYTCVPKNTRAVQSIVKFAKARNLGVRCSGYRHSWSPVFARNGGILISTLNLELATKIPNFTSLGIGQEPPKELNSITLLPEQPADGKTKLVRVGCATTNEQLREWCISSKIATLPLNVIMVEITLGGSNAPICHGAGRRHQTLSDLVHQIEYVDVNGEAQIIGHTDEEFLRAASGCFGLLGVVTHLTLRFEPMSYAVMKPRKLRVYEAIPPPPGYIIPLALRPKQRLTSTEIAKAQADFEKRASDDYYAEWFWFPYSDYVWVNTWETTDDPTGVEDYPNSFNKVLQLAGTLLTQVLQNTAALTKTQQIFPLTRTTLLSKAAMLNLPPYEIPLGLGNNYETIRTWVPDALHFQRAIQNVRVRDTEVEMPLVPSNADPTKPDWSYVQRAWWDAILHAYQYTETCPQRFPLEMRIMGGSNVIMAPQRGNMLGTCSIEILTLQTEVDTWQPYAQELIDTWMSYKNRDGKLLNTRPHWAKEWYPFTVAGKPWLDYLREVSYKDEIKEFKDVLTKIGLKQGWTLSDLKNMFSNEMFDQIYFDDVALPTSRGAGSTTVLGSDKVTPYIATQEVVESLE